MNRDLEISRQGYSHFARLFLEVTLVMIFVFVMTYHKGHSSGAAVDPLKIKSNKPAAEGQKAALDITTIEVTASGFIVNGKSYTREALVAYLNGEGQRTPLVSIQPGHSMTEDLRWLLDTAGKTHDIELAL
jgi:hypothetical protein